MPPSIDQETVSQVSVAIGRAYQAKRCLGLSSNQIGRKNLMPTICSFEGWRDPLVFRVPEPRQGLYLQGGAGGIRQRGRSAYTSHGFL